MAKRPLLCRLGWHSMPPFGGMHEETLIFQDNGFDVAVKTMFVSVPCIRDGCDHVEKRPIAQSITQTKERTYG